MSEFVDDDMAELDHVAGAQDRLRILLFLVDKKLSQRHALRLRVFVIMTSLLLISLALLIAGGATVQRIYFQGSRKVDYSVLDWAWHWTLIVALAPFVMTFMHYLWITFFQMYSRSFRDVADLLHSTDYEEFRPYIHSEILADDGSFLSVMQGLLTVDIGLTSALFALAGFVCAWAPVAVQAITSAGATIIVLRDNKALAFGLGIFYVLFLVMSAAKTFRLFMVMRRMR